METLDKAIRACDGDYHKNGDIVTWHGKEYKVIRVFGKIGTHEEMYTLRPVKMQNPENGRSYEDVQISNGQLRYQ